MPFSHMLIVAPPDSTLGHALSDALVALGGSPVQVSTAADALTVIERARPDAVAVELDGDSPSGGITLIRRIRVLSSLPIIALARVDDSAGVTQALVAGADDYLTNIPSSPEVLDAQLAALQRRLDPSSPLDESTFRVRDLSVDLARCEASIGEHPVALTPTEFRIVATLTRYAGSVVSGQRLMREAAGYYLSDEGAANLVKVHVRRLRAKLRLFEGDSPYIRNVRGFGYMIERRTRERPDDFLSDYGEAGDVEP